MKIDFEFETQYGIFRDAIWFPDEQPIPSDDEIEVLKQQRLNNWLTLISSPPSSEEIIDNQIVQE